MTAQAIVKINIMVNAGIGCVSVKILAPSNSNIILKRIWAMIKAIAAFASIENLFENPIIIISFWTYFYPECTFIAPVNSSHLYERDCRGGVWTTMALSFPSSG